MITIVNYGCGNLISIKNMIKRLGFDSIISTNLKEIESADKLILPGVGSFDYGMKQLTKSGFISVLNEKVLKDQIPILGICLGAQLLTEGSSEGTSKGLSWIKGKTIAFDKSKLETHHKIPHMGWNEVRKYHNSKLFVDMYDNPRFYFVHSFRLELENFEDILATTNYGYEFPAGIERGNILGVQFHPEKSHKYGMKILENFIKYY